MKPNIVNQLVRWKKICGCVFTEAFWPITGKWNEWAVDDRLKMCLVPFLDNLRNISMSPKFFSYLQILQIFFHLFDYIYRHFFLLLTYNSPDPDINNHHVLIIRCVEKSLPHPPLSCFPYSCKLNLQCPDSRPTWMLYASFHPTPNLLFPPLYLPIKLSYPTQFPLCLS